MQDLSLDEIQATWYCDVSGRLYSIRSGEEVGFSNNTGYHLVKYKNKLYVKHRILWMLYHNTQIPFQPNGELYLVDHKNRIRDDNSKDNLRLATRVQQQHNRRKQSNSTAPFKGITAVDGKWLARIWNNGKRESLGRFITPEEASAAYEKRSLELYGDFNHISSIQ